MPVSVQLAPPNRYCVFATSAGCPLNGAASDMMRSRCGTLFRMSPLSSASTQMSVGRLERRPSMARGPVMTPLTGTLSAIGTSATVRTFSPRRFHTSTSRGNCAREGAARTAASRAETRTYCSIRRRVPAEDARPAERRSSSCGGIDEGQLRRRVVLEERLVMRRWSAGPGTCG